MLEDVSGPRRRLADMGARIGAVATGHDLLIGPFGHAGDGNLLPAAVIDARDPSAADRPHAAFAEIFAAALELDGTISGEHGVGAAKLPYLRDRLGDDQMALTKRIKAAFDPAGILNPGKVGS